MKLVSYLFIIVFLSSCSSYLTSSENISKTKTAYEKILVIGRSKDQTARIKFENQVVAKLKENGVMAKASYEVNDTKTLRNEVSESKTAALVESLLSQGFDGAILTNLINTEEYTDVIPGNSSTTYVPARYGRFGRQIGYYPISTWEPDQLKTGTKYIFESSFYKLSKKKGGNLEWIGRFELKDPTSLEKTTSNYAKELVGELLKSNINTK